MDIPHPGQMAYRTKIEFLISDTDEVNAVLSLHLAGLVFDFPEACVDLFALVPRNLRVELNDHSGNFLFFFLLFLPSLSPFPI